MQIPTRFWGSLYIVRFAKLVSHIELCSEDEGSKENTFLLTYAQIDVSA